MGDWWERSDGFRVILRSEWDFFLKEIFLILDYYEQWCGA